MTVSIAPLVDQYLEAYAGEPTALPRLRRLHQDALVDLFLRHYVAIAETWRPDGQTKRFDILGALDMLMPRIVTRRLLGKAEREAALFFNALDRDILAAAAVETKARFRSIRDLPAAFVASLREIGRRAKRRAKTAANMATQDVTEEFRMEVATRDRDVSGDLYKQWQDMRDEKVRAAHRAAHDQIQPVDGTFTVGGEQLRFPGDRSLGASLGNVINCRCEARYLAEIEPGVLAPTGIATPRLPARRTRRTGEIVR